MVSPAALGVDFGTSHTVALARSGDGGFAPLLFDGSPLLPSAVFAETDGGLSVGRDAVNSVRLDPARFEPHPKRCIDDGSVLLGDKEFSTVDMVCAVLSQVRREYSRVTGGDPATVAMTYPAAWGPTRRLVLMDAAERAGLSTPEMVPEPVAAATYFAGGQHIPADALVVVADFGGGTFDCSLVRRTEAGFDVVTVDGHDQLGGVDVDEAMVARLRTQLGGDDWSRLLTPATAEDRRHRRGFYDDVRAAKERLSRRPTADIYLPVFDRDAHVTREELEAVARPLLDQAVTITNAVIRLSRADKSQIAGLFLVGGGSRMPLVATMLHQATGLAPTVLEQPELVVAQGALLAAAEAATPETVPFAPSPAQGAARAAAPPSAMPPQAQPPRPPSATPQPPPAQPAPAAPHTRTEPVGRRPRRLWLAWGLIFVQLVMATMLARISLGGPPSGPTGPLHMDEARFVLSCVALLGAGGLLVIRRPVALWTSVALQIAALLMPWL